MHYHYYCQVFFLFLVTLFLSSARAADKDVRDDWQPSFPDNWSDEFDWQLFKEYHNVNGNVVLSPISLRVVMSLLCSGAAGKTKTEIQNVMHFADNDTIVDQTFKNILQLIQAKSKHFELDIGTRIFLDPEFSPQQKFQSTADVSYDAKIQATNFSRPAEASDVINAWVAELTRGNVRELVHPDQIKRAVMIVANAVYFRGTWEHQFKRQDTHGGRFHVTPSETVDNVPFMTMSDTFHFVDSSALDAKVLRLPYRGDHLAMYVMLPSARGGLDGLVQRLTPTLLRRELSKLESTFVNVVLPRFKFDFKTELSNTLKRFGLASMFYDSASFPGITRNENAKLVVSDIIQRAGIDVNEEGTEAYAATDVQVVNKFGDMQSSFNATSPFMFFIEENRSKTILFVGRVQNPLETQPETPTNVESEQSAFPPVAIPAEMPLNSFRDPAVPVLGVDSQAPITSAPPLQMKPSAVVTLRPHDKRRFNYFDLELLEVVHKPYENVFVSPASIKTALSMILEGAQGQSADEIMGAFRISNINEARALIREYFQGIDDKKKSAILESGQALFVSDRYANNDALIRYRAVLEQFYQSSVYTRNFLDASGTARDINHWVNRTTHGLVPQIVQAGDIEPSGYAVLLSAMYFKADWVKSFDEGLTRTQCFHPTPNTCRYVHMMHLKDSLHYAFIGNIDAHAVELPYKDGTFAMLLLVPKKANQLRILRDLTHVTLSLILNELEPMEVVLQLPRFEIDYAVDLTDTLKKLHISDIFSGHANLTGLASKGAKIDSIHHRTYVKVNEKGTVAAGATAASVIPLIGGTAPLVFADQPFVFLIYNRAREQIIFEGIVNAPTEAPAPQNKS